ncbi:MAG: hypothetical protein WC749_05745 [Dehalococcoidia bacterium]
MSGTVRVEKEIEFKNLAEHKRNVLGPMQEDLIHFKDDFTNVTLDSNVWATSVPGTSDSIAIAEVAGGEVLITTGTVDDDSCMMATAIIFSAAKKAKCHARITIDDVSGTALFVGFSDAKSESNNSIAIHYHADALTTVATDAAGFVIDADHSTSSIMLAGVKNGTDATAVDTEVDWADGETKELRVELDGDDNAIFYLDNAPVGRVADAVTTSTLLCFTIQAMTRANDGANTVQGHNVAFWCERT